MYAVYVQIQVDPENRSYQWFGPFFTEAEREAAVAAIPLPVLSSANYTLTDVNLGSLR